CARSDGNYGYFDVW
nr:immunoglobulin heavy chain junction region [Mus musculus]MBK4188934.1 immunoglobulin heavy chain junction region [Mus musculus]MBK4188935.1 immunoglobulin heavy chain junction region [Mus musculus]